jgi:hypothetical protein
MNANVIKLFKILIFNAGHSTCTKKTLNLSKYNIRQGYFKKWIVAVARNIAGLYA